LKKSKFKINIYYYIFEGKMTTVFKQEIKDIIKKGIICDENIDYEILYSSLELQDDEYEMILIDNFDFLFSTTEKISSVFAWSLWSGYKKLFDKTLEKINDNSHKFTTINYTNDNINEFKEYLKTCPTLTELLEKYPI